MTTFDVSDNTESYRYLSNDETEISTNIHSLVSDGSFIQKGVEALDNWDESDNVSENEYQSSPSVMLKNKKDKKTRQKKSSEEREKSWRSKRDVSSTSGNSANTAHTANTANTANSINPMANTAASTEIRNPSLSRLSQTTAADQSSSVVHSTPLVKSNASNTPSGIMKSGTRKNAQNTATDDSFKKRNVSFQLNGAGSIVSPTEEIHVDTDTENWDKWRDFEDVISNLRSSLQDTERKFEEFRKEMELKGTSEQRSSKDDVVPPVLNKNGGKKRVKEFGTYNKIHNKTQEKTQENFSRLGLDDIDSMKREDLQDILKNVCIEFNTPVDMLPQVAKQYQDLQKFSKHMFKFVSTVHMVFYQNTLQKPILFGNLNRFPHYYTVAEMNRSKQNFLKCLNQLSAELHYFKQYVFQVD